MVFLYGIVYGRSSVFRKVVKSVGTGTLAGTYIIIAAWLCIDVLSAYKCKISLTDQKMYYLCRYMPRTCYHNWVKVLAFTH